MGHFFGFYVFFSAIALAAAQTRPTFGLFVVDEPTVTPAPRIVASVIGHGPGPSIVSYSIECPGEPDRNPWGITRRDPCDRIDRATVTVGPNQMLLDVSYQTHISTAGGFNQPSDVTTHAFVNMYVRSPVVLLLFLLLLEPASRDPVSWISN